MTSLTSLLVGTDFSADGANAVRRAALLARELGARLRILHVLNATGCRPLRNWFSPASDSALRVTEARAALQHLAVEVSAACDWPASIEVAVGDPFEILMQASEHADLVVLGRRNHVRFQRLLMARTVDRMLRTCQRPVLVVKTSVKGSYRRVMVPIDFTASADTALRVADQMQREAGMHVFHATHSKREALLRKADMPEHVIREIRLMEEGGIHMRMRRMVARLGLDSTPMNFALAYGPPVRTTLRHAHRLAADLIVTGKQTRCAWDSVSSRVLSEATCDLLIVPGPREGSPLHAAAAVSPPPGLELCQDKTAAAPRSAAPAGASTRDHWIYNKARFVARRTS